MVRRRPALVGVMISLIAACGCSDLTGPRLLTTFDWGEVEDPENIVEGISTTVVLGDFFLAGHFPTPSRCFNLSADFERDDSRVTVRVLASETSSPNCDQTDGGFRYTASITNLDFGTYTLRVFHEATGNEFTETVTVR